MLALLSVFLVVVCLYDYRWRRIPNRLLIIMALTGIGISVYRGGFRGGGFFLLQMSAVMLILYPLFKIGVLGAGDIKLFGVCSGYLPHPKILFFLFISLAFAAIISLIKFIRERNAIERFSYFCEYIMEVWRSGTWHLYIEDNRERVANSIPLAGPVLGSVLLYWGGIY